MTWSLGGITCRPNCRWSWRDMNPPFAHCHSPHQMSALQGTFEKCPAEEEKKRLKGSRVNPLPRILAYICMHCPQIRGRNCHIIASAIIGNLRVVNCILKFRKGADRWIVRMSRPWGDPVHFQNRELMSRVTYFVETWCTMKTPYGLMGTSTDRGENNNYKFFSRFIVSNATQRKHFDQTSFIFLNFLKILTKINNH